MICLGDNHSQIEPAFRDVSIQWINEDNEGNKSVLIEAFTHETKLSFSNYINYNFCFVYILL